MSENYIALRWLKTALAGVNAPGGIRRGAADPNTPTPYVTVNYYNGVDDNGPSGVRIKADMKWLVEVWAPDAQEAAAEVVASAVDAALHLQRNITVTDTDGVTPIGTMISCLRVESRFMSQVDGDVLWTRQGGVYRMLVNNTTP